MTIPNNEELQRLLDAAKPGEWYLHKDETGDPDGTYIHDTKDVMCIAITPIGSGSDYREDDLRLASLAPVLAAEVIRLRKAIEAEAKVSYTRADKCDAKFSFERAAWHREKANHLDRILEGDQP